MGQGLRGLCGTAAQSGRELGAWVPVRDSELWIWRGWSLWEQELLISLGSQGEESLVGFQTWVESLRVDVLPGGLVGTCLSWGQGRRIDPCSLTGFGSRPSLASHLGLLSLVAPGPLPCLPRPSLPPLSLLPPLHYRLPGAELLMAPDYPGVWEMTTTAAPPPPTPGCPPPPETSQPTTNLYPRLMLGAGRQVGREGAEDEKAEVGRG